MSAVGLDFFSRAKLGCVWLNILDMPCWDLTSAPCVSHDHDQYAHDAAANEAIYASSCGQPEKPREKNGDGGSRVTTNPST